MGDNKTEILRARVPASLKEAIAELCTERGESEAVILREALLDYLAQREIFPLRGVIQEESGNYRTKSKTGTLKTP